MQTLPRIGTMAEGALEFRGDCLARVGLLGNPSDGFGGQTLSFTLANWRARARLQLFEGSPTAGESGIRIGLGPGSSCDHSFASLLSQIEREGHPPALSLLTATLKVYRSYFADSGFLDGSWSLAVDSDIPEQVGLAGSSAIILATLRALCAAEGRTLQPEWMASLALHIEREELGIAAGLQDRVAQSLEGLISMDFSPAAMCEQAGLQVGTYTRLPVRWLPDSLYVAWSRRGKEPTTVLHAGLRQRFLAGEPAVVAAMPRFAAFAREGVQALQQADLASLNRLIDANFDLRHSICPLNPLHVEMIRKARSLGCSAKYCGSGGAIVGLLPDGMTHAVLAERMAEIDCEVVRPDLSPR